MVNRSRGERAYTVIDTETDPSETAEALAAIGNVYRVRVLS